MTSNGDELSALMWNQLITVLEAAQGVGGRLSGVPSGAIYRGAQLWKDLAPAIGVQHLSYKETPYAGYKHAVTVEFLIVAGAVSEPTFSGSVMTAPANLDAANSALDAILSDGNGNGIGPVLRDVVNDGLRQSNGNALANQSQIVQLNRTWELRTGLDMQERIWAYATYTYRAVTYIFV